MDKEEQPAGAAGSAPLEPKSSVHSDLQYVSIQLDGSTYGGWYRLLPDGQMELLALANMHCERRTESTPVEQAQGMLTDFIRGVRRKTKSDGTGTLGALLYADPTKPRVAEHEWVGLIRSVAAGDVVALHGLYERTHRIVFTLLARLTHNLEVAEQLTVDVFREIWSLACKYDPAQGSVLGWIMNHTRSKAIDHWGHDWGKRAIAREHEPQSHWPAEVLQPSSSLWNAVVERLGVTIVPALSHWNEPAWEDVAPGISCKLLATDADNARVSMLVRLAPGTDYPPHTHAGIEELHLLQGELMINARKVFAGDYNRAEAGTSDKRVWSETGCMCVLMTSTKDALG